MRSVRLWLVFPLALLFLLTCGPVKTPDGLTASLALDRTEYFSGDTLRFWLTFRNPTTRTRSVTTTETPVYEVIVSDSLDAGVIHFPGAYLQVFSTLTLPPGDSATDSASFMLTHGRIPLLPGEYRVRGKLLGYDLPYAEQPITVTLQ